MTFKTWALKKLAPRVRKRISKETKEKIKLKLLKNFDTGDNNTLIFELLKVLPDETVRLALFRRLFPIDYKEPLEEKRRFEIYSKLNHDSFIKLFKSRYTRSYEAFFLAKTDEDRDQLKGRILEIQNIIDMCVRADEVLANWDRRMKVIESKKKIINYLKKQYNGEF